MARRYREEMEDSDIPDSVKRMRNNKNKKNNKNAKKIKNDKEIPEKKKHPILKKIVLVLICILVLFLIVRLIISTHRWKSLAKDMLLNEGSIVLDSDGNTISTLGSGKGKIKVSFEQIPDNLKEAYISIEDERYYSHGGVDVKRTAAAIGSYIIHLGSSSFGGSTITQQLVKNMTGDSSDKISRKVSEWWRASTLESCASKEEILGAYLNTIYVGPNTYGVEAGAQYYFSKSVKDLSLEECAFLAGINHSPNSYNPFSDKTDSEKIKKRTKTVLSKMKDLNKISNEDYESACKNVDSGLNFKKGTITTGSGVYSYHTDALINQVTEEIAEKYKISKTFANNYLENAGATIQGTQNSKVQSEIEKEFEKKKYQLASNTGGDPSQAAMVIMDHKTGQVVGCAGGLGKKTQSRPLNRATQSVRQTGSAMKPIAILAPAIDKKIITCASLFDDTEKDFEGGYHPEDYNKPLGMVTVRRAVESSQNVPFVEIMEELKPKNSIKYMKKMGITTLTDKDDNLSLALGGLDKGISPLEMAGAYSTIANDGEYIEPTFYTEVTRKNGKRLIKNKQEKHQVFSEEVAYVLKELLTQPVLGSKGTATYCKINGVDVAAKTGTTDENYDRWLCGFTPYYTATCWYGYDKNETVNFNKKNPAGLIWANVMTRIHSGLASAIFERPSKVEVATICNVSGEKATTGCTDTYTEFFVKGTVPRDCEIHVGTPIVVDERSTYRNNSGTIKGIDKEIDAEEPQRDNWPSSGNTTSTENVVRNEVSNKVENKTNTTNSTNTSNTVQNTNNVVENRNETVTPSASPSTTPKQTVKPTNEIGTSPEVENP